MKAEIGNYLIETDSKQFVVKRKGIVKESKLTKAENVGTEKIDAIAYCTTIDSALKVITNQVLLDNDDLKEIITILKDIKAEIGNIRKIFDSIVEE